MSSDAVADRRAGSTRGAGQRRKHRAGKVGRALGDSRFASSVRGLGAISVLGRRTIVAALRPPYDYGPELASQFLFGLRMAWFPLVLASIAFTYGPAGIQAAGFLNLFGALDQIGRAHV